MLQLFLSPEYGDYEFEWSKVYGSVYRIKGCLGQDRLMVSDPMALQYVLNSPSFHFSSHLQAMFIWFFGPKSMVARKGDDHKQLRAFLSPAFTAAAVRRYQPVFAKVAQRMTEQLESYEARPVDMCPLLSDATLSSISEGSWIESPSLTLSVSSFSSYFWLPDGRFRC